MDSPTPSDLAAAIKALDRAVRVGFFVFTLLFCYSAIRLSLSIDLFSHLFNQMLAGPPTDSWTRIALQGKTAWIGLSIILPILALAFAAKARQTSTAIYGMAAITTVSFALTMFLWSAISSPLVNLADFALRGN